MLKYNYSKSIEAGCDESGRGALAGPVVAAAVILPKNYKNKSINDSKIVSLKERLRLENTIKKEAISWAIGIADVKEIDKLNILNASILAMHRAINKLNKIPERLLIDGNQFKTYKDIKHTCIIKGDSKFMSIAAASILAKTHRDKIMLELDKIKPLYNWSKNKGYPTQQHKKNIIEFGITRYHRKSFQLL